MVVGGGWLGECGWWLSGCFMVLDERSCDG